MARLRSIEFTASGTNAGLLTFKKADGTVIETVSILGNPIWLFVGDADASLTRNYTITEESELAPDYKATLPFGSTSDLVDLKFGDVKTVGTTKLENYPPATERHVITHGISNKFYVSTIGTDDLRNGKFENTVFNIDNKDVYLNIVSGAGSTKILEIGYKAE